MTDEENGLGHLNIKLSEEAMLHFSRTTNGDLRSALNALELAAESTEADETGTVHIPLAIAEECLQRKAMTHDKDGDAHYDVISAFQKSIRGSDVHAALHYLARLVEAGELQIICRRLMIIAYEDIGLANPAGAARAVTAVMAAEKTGFPEARIPLANAVIELCLSEKSNTAYSALDAALADVRAGKGSAVPDHLKDAHYQGAKDLGRGVDYKYPHSYDDGWVKQQYLPDTLINAKYYTPKPSSKFESALAKQYEKFHQDKL